MMVIVGTSTYLRYQSTFQGKCPCCDVNNTNLELQLYCDYTHLTLIPLFPVKRHGSIHCTACNTPIAYEDLSQDCKAFVDAIAQKKRRFPIWTFTGSLAILLSLSILIKYWYVKSHTDYPLEQLQKGDVVFYETKNGYYSSFKILERNGPVFKVVHNDYIQNTFFDLDDLNEPANYRKQKETLTLSDLNTMETKGFIEGIEKSKLNSF
ncbi:hypothetical protein [Flavobacterium sp.]|jgi:hypothetical protein|uniref:hypothetical protein n=1 Tax=Flavobacterium sp. TaxID=239 RepID=UPI0022C03BB2|nr:hypothetical protein [Flavobacterium sp.]MCZ8143992.1 hypothetical protein [Flavobacterium sp.]MCZ8366477.1 hypothetical protein [Flavobacterium sp.]